MSSLVSKDPLNCLFVKIFVDNHLNFRHGDNLFMIDCPLLNTGNHCLHVCRYILWHEAGAETRSWGDDWDPGSVFLWLSQPPRLSSVQHQTARGEMTDDGENAELRTAEAGGGAGRGGAGAGGRPASRDLLCRGVPRCAAGPGPDAADAPS